MKYDRVLLIGMMGAGKTTVGHELATLLGWPYYDNDELLARAVGKDTRRVQEEDGIAALRRAESAALTVALSEGGPLIAGVAGGIVTDPLDVERLRAGGFVVWLRADIAALVARVKGTDRPWLGQHPDVAMSHLYAGRAAMYAAASSLILDEANTTPAQLALRIAEQLQRCTP
ncbi:MAG TPA: shikimate kinase [Mycobacteriales bacterium]|jgi:shikimate kinase|nr:shikimate kinase [Mycobacteriales bacterium]